MRVLVIEDEELSAEVMLTTLESKEIPADVAIDVEEALELLNYGNKYDVFVIDLMLPQKSGEDFIKHIRGNNDGTPIIVVSGKAARDEKDHCFELGADFYFTKPADLRDVANTVLAIQKRVHFERNIASIRNTVTLSDNLVVHLDDKMVHFKEERLPLAKGEYRLFETLAIHQGKPVDLRSLRMNLLTDSTHGTAEESVVRALNRLKKKVEELTQEQCSIQTLPNKHYMLTF